MVDDSIKKSILEWLFGKQALDKASQQGAPTPQPSMPMPDPNFDMKKAAEDAKKRDDEIKKQQMKKKPIVPTPGAMDKLSGY